MRIGIDFDGTVALYDEAFYQCAVGQFQMPREIAANKPAIRTWFWRTPEGKQRWVELQGIVYGTRMSEARSAPGLEEFLQMCREREIGVSIISHKTEFPAAGPHVNLRKAAMHWLEQNGFHGAPGIRREDVFFESTRQGKIRRIVAQRCSHFIDDLEEVFREPAFPAGVARLLYAPGAKDDGSRDFKAFSSWDAIREYFLNAIG